MCDPPGYAPGGPVAPQFEALRTRRPRGGLAIGRSVDPRTRRPRLEMRVTAQCGPNYAAAEKLARRARADGVDVILKVMKNAIMGGAPEPPAIGGRCRPLHIGSSVANRESLAGTLGAFVRLPADRVGALSCGHVLARTGKRWGVVGDPIHQPGLPDAKLVVETDRIGGLSEYFAPFIDCQVNNLDAAVARLDEVMDYEGNVMPNEPCVPAELRGKPIGPPLDADMIENGLRVVKVGRTTGYTEATISATDFENLRVDLTKAQTFTFSNVYEVLWDEGVRFAAGGDSGALVLSRDGLQPVGLHFASMPGDTGAGASYVIPWFRIADNLQVQLL